jgi:hypothetical protein
VSASARGTVRERIDGRGLTSDRLFEVYFTRFRLSLTENQDTLKEGILKSTAVRLALEYNRPADLLQDFSTRCGDDDLGRFRQRAARLYLFPN